MRLESNPSRIASILLKYIFLLATVSFLSTLKTDSSRRKRQIANNSTQPSLLPEKPFPVLDYDHPPRRYKPSTPPIPQTEAEFKAEERRKTHGPN